MTPKPGVVDFAADLDPVGDRVGGGQIGAEGAGAGVAVAGEDARLRHPPGQTDGVVALGATDIEDERIGAGDDLLDHRGEGGLVAAEPPGDIAAFGGGGVVDHPLERAVIKDRGAALPQGVGEDLRPPFRQQAEGLVEGRGAGVACEDLAQLVGDGLCQRRRVRHFRTTRRSGP
jgi:hypothetical protein